MHINCNDFTIERIATPEEERKLITSPYYAVYIEDKNLSNFVKMIANVLKIPNYLKRVKTLADKKCVLLQPVNNDINIDVSQFIDNKDLIIIEVPAYKPVTAAQSKEWNKLWPCNFFPQKEKAVEIDKYITDSIILLKEYNGPVYCSGRIIIGNPVLKTILMFEDDRPWILEHAIFVIVQKYCQTTDQYLCTGLDAFILNEPCFACAMALTHARIGRVFMINKVEEGPYTKMKLCYNRALNHRYPVYEIKINTNNRKNKVNDFG